VVTEDSLPGGEASGSPEFLAHKEAAPQGDTLFQYPVLRGFLVGFSPIIPEYDMNYL
jgi:hypothetical protein